MAQKTFQIILDSADNTFSPGEMVTGKIIVDIDRTESIRGLKVRIKGEAEVKWSKTEGSGNKRRTIWYTGSEQYFRIEYYLIEASGNSETVDIQSGHHVFPFNFSLPRDIPSSFQHANGGVAYTLKAVMDRPWKFDHQTKMSFTVEAPYDITQCPNAMTIIEDEEVETFGCFACLGMGSMRVNVYVPRTGFAIGDAIEARVAINNTSRSVDVTGVKLLIEQDIKLHSQFPHSETKRDSNVIQKCKKTGPFRKNDVIGLELQVPAVPPSHLSHCSIIDIVYRLTFKISVSGCHCSTKKSYPILIGTSTARNFQSMRNNDATAGLTKNPSHFGPVEANVPSAPFFTDDMTSSVGTIPFPMPMTGQQFTNPVAIPFPMPTAGGHFSYPVPSGLEPNNQIYPPPMPCLSANPRFQYPPAVAPAIGFVHRNPMLMTTSTEFTEIPPPSYDACTRSSKNK